MDVAGTALAVGGMIMSKFVDMSKFQPLTGNLEEYLNKQGCTLGKDAVRLQKLYFSIQYCYVHGVLTDSETQKAWKRFHKQFKEALHEIEEEDDEHE